MEMNRRVLQRCWKCCVRGYFRIIIIGWFVRHSIRAVSRWAAGKTCMVSISIGTTSIGYHPRLHRMRLGWHGIWYRMFLYRCMRTGRLMGFIFTKSISWRIIRQGRETCCMRFRNIWPLKRLVKSTGTRFVSPAGFIMARRRICRTNGLRRSILQSAAARFHSPLRHRAKNAWKSGWLRISLASGV